MSLGARPLLVGIRDVDLPVHEHLSVHGFNSCIRRVKGVKGYKAKSLAGAGVFVSFYFGGGDDHAKCRKCVVQELWGVWGVGRGGVG